MRATSAASAGEPRCEAVEPRQLRVIGHARVPRPAASVPRLRVERAGQRLARGPAADVVGDPGAQQRDRHLRRVGGVGGDDGVGQAPTADARRAAARGR